MKFVRVIPAALLSAALFTPAALVGCKSGEEKPAEGTEAKAGCACPEGACSCEACKSGDMANCNCGK